MERGAKRRRITAGTLARECHALRRSFGGPMRTWLFLSVLALVLPACGKAACAAPMSPDAPVAASDPR